MFKVTVSVISPPKPDSIWAKLAERLGREPTDAETVAEVKRILRGEPIA